VPLQGGRHWLLASMMPAQFVLIDASTTFGIINNSSEMRLMFQGDALLRSNGQGDPPGDMSLPLPFVVECYKTIRAGFNEQVMTCQDSVELLLPFAKFLVAIKGRLVHLAAHPACRQNKHTCKAKRKILHAIKWSALTFRLNVRQLLYTYFPFCRRQRCFANKFNR